MEYEPIYTTEAEPAVEHVTEAHEFAVDKPMQLAKPATDTPPESVRLTTVHPNLAKAIAAHAELAAHARVATEDETTRVKEWDAETVAEFYPDLVEMLVGSDNYHEAAKKVTNDTTASELVFQLHETNVDGSYVVEHVTIIIRRCNAETASDSEPSSDYHTDDILENENAVTASYSGSYELDEQSITIDAGGETYVITQPDGDGDDAQQVWRLHALLHELIAEGDGAQRTTESAMEQVGGEEPSFIVSTTVYSYHNGQLAFEVVQETYLLEALISAVEDGASITVVGGSGQLLTLDDLYARRLLEDEEEEEKEEDVPAETEEEEDPAFVAESAVGESAHHHTPTPQYREIVEYVNTVETHRVTHQTITFFRTPEATMTESHRDQIITVSFESDSDHGADYTTVPFVLTPQEQKKPAIKKKEDTVGIATSHEHIPLTIDEHPASSSDATVTNARNVTVTVERVDIAAAAGKTAARPAESQTTDSQIIHELHITESLTKKATVDALGKQLAETAPHHHTTESKSKHEQASRTKKTIISGDQHTPAATTIVNRRRQTSHTVRSLGKRMSSSGGWQSYSSSYGAQLYVASGTPAVIIEQALTAASSHRQQSDGIHSPQYYLTATDTGYTLFCEGENISTVTNSYESIAA